MKSVLHVVMNFSNCVLGTPGETAFRATDQGYDNDKQYKKVITLKQIQIS